MKLILLFFFFKQKTAYEMRISDWSSDVCSSDLYYTGPAAALCLSCASTRSRQAISRPAAMINGADRKSVVLGKSVSVRVDLGGRRLIKKTNKPSPIEESNINNLSTT